jgi:CubicO group peptidase (beta-lactamase class C family)
MLKCSGAVCKAVFVVAIIASVSFESLARGKSSRQGLQLSNREAERISRFERGLEELRNLLKIPGMSAAIIKDGRVLWANGFGFSDYENKVAATPETPYEIASLTKTFAATLLMQLVEQGKVSLDDPMSKYSDEYQDDRVKVRHVLTHTSEGGSPGESYQYNGNLFDNLTGVVMKASGKRYRLLLAENILAKIGMTATSPGNDYADNPAELAQLLGEANVKNYLEALKRLARPYKLYGADEIIHTYNPRRGIGAANGIISTVIDLAKYDAAIDRNLFVRKQTQDEMWTPAVSKSGETLPYGLGWFVQRYRGLKLIWHNGNMPDLYSALILKVPEKRITFILLANSDALSSPFKLGAGNVMHSAFACHFMRSFVFEEMYGVTLPEPGRTLNEKARAAEIARLEKQGRGYKYDCETASLSAMNSWLDARRASARREIKVARENFAAYAGQYQLDSGAVLTILDEGGKLMRQGKVLKMELFPESETSFFSKVVEAQYTFVKDDSGQVTQLKIKQGEDEVIAKKVK